MPAATSWLTGLSSTTRRCPRVVTGSGSAAASTAPCAAPSTAVSVVWSCERCTGLLSRAAIPAARASSVWSSESEVSSTMPMPARAGSRLMPRATSMPSISGMQRSRIASAYAAPAPAAARSAASADGPSSTRSTSRPQAPSCSPRISRLVWLSSTTRTRRPASRSLDRAGPTVVVGGQRQRHREPERAARAGLAVDPDRAAHRGDQLAGDGEPEAGAAELAGGRGVGLGEGVEQPLTVLVVDADAGVGDLEPDDHARRGRSPRAGRGSRPRPPR